MEDYINTILDKLGYFYEDIAYKNISYGCLIEALINTNNMREASKILNITENVLEKFLPKLIYKPTNISWKFYLLQLVDIRICYKCKVFRNLITEYTWRGIGLCKICEHNRIFTDEQRVKKSIKTKEHYYNNKYKYILKNMLRKAHVKQVTPNWANDTAIKAIYDNCPTGYHVDHVIPLKNSLVSGLHVENNLQYLPAKDNLSKSNKYIVE